MGSNHSHAFFSFTSLPSPQSDSFRARCSRVWHLTWANYPFFTLCKSKGWACCRSVFALHRKYSHPVGSRVNQKEFCGSEAPTQPRIESLCRRMILYMLLSQNNWDIKILFSYLLMEETSLNILSLHGLPLQIQAQQMSWYKASFS